MDDAGAVARLGSPVRARPTASAAVEPADLGGPPIFVGGVNRSGTTLVARMIGSHRSVAVPPTELLFFGRGWHGPLSGRADFERRLREIVSSGRVREWGLDAEALVARSRALPPTPRSLLALVLEAYRRRAGRPRVGEKSVLNERRLGLLERWFPDFRLVQMVRDPISTFASGRNGQHGVGHALEWARVWSSSASVAARAERNRHLVVRYEDLVEDPARVALELCAFMGVPPDAERMVALADYREKENSSFDGVDRGAEYRGAVRRRDALDRRSTVRRWERRAIARVCGSLAEELGYDLGEPAPRAPDRLVLFGALAVARGSRAAIGRLRPAA
jgi:Sulfotransferase family